MASVPRVLFGTTQLDNIYHISDPKEGMKNQVIDGFRGDGCIVVPGGKQSTNIEVWGVLTGDDYDALATKIEALKTAINTDPTTLSLEDEWSYLVRRVEEITFEESLRNYSQKYYIKFLVISY